MRGLMRQWVLGAMVALALGGAWAQDNAAAGKAPPAGFVAPPEPQPGDTNAQRAKSQPGNNAPFWRGVRESGRIEGYTTLPDNEGGTLVQEFRQYPGSLMTTAGEAWRQVRNDWIIPYGGALLLIVVVALALFYWRVGKLGHAGPTTTRQIERFTPFERAAHWANAVAFVILALSGIVMAFGKFLLLPLIGSALFGWLTYALKTAHNFAGPVFAVSLVIIFFTFLRDNLPRRGDLRWLLRFGGLMSEREVPSHRFNAGEKLVFWLGVLILGAVVVVSGLVLDKLMPGIEYTRSVMQIANMVHAIATVLMIAVFIGHIYIGTIGMRGAYGAMRTGYVDEAWAREHHEYWYEDLKAGRVPRLRSAEAKGTAGRPAAQL